MEIFQGCYYLVDAGYTNADGFLAPYRGQRYHLGRFTARNPPRSAEEYFNMRHASARNIVERSFGRLKGRWAILRCLVIHLRMRTRMRMRTRYHWIYLRENSPNLSLSQLFRHLMIGQIFATLLLMGCIIAIGLIELWSILEAQALCVGEARTRGFGCTLRMRS
ncbi:Os01g0523700 [Oryza sativa Japonica Group]|uniref:Os01g0523700 protein n=1 Tax=Oryza sativa subsp. japonica TaxID=39947 RepID=C7IWW7_ORYSJ|nr:Os01g0523700 [Oryza sativa Japonica Group]|eukprot:NP_001172384.1 Os01g0523700 [Oryza sativa Japonica Group]